MKILFVCTGNTCRSPMAKALAEEWLQKNAFQADIRSAGLSAFEGVPASVGAADAMASHGLSLQDHRARQITEKELADTDLVLTMTRNHKKQARSLCPRHADRIYTLSEYAGLPEDIEDPFGGALSVYENCARALRIRIETALRRIMARGELMEGITVIDHPLVQHKISLLRNIQTGNKEFRELVEEIATLICYEATRDIPTVEQTIETPICQTTARVIEQKIGIIPILRAGIGMMDGMLKLLPTAKVGHIGLYRDPATLQPVEYYGKLPVDAAEREILLIDPMLATGGTACFAIESLKRQGVKRVKLLCLIAAPEGARKVQAEHPDVRIYAAAFDNCLNEHGYIVPGLGDAGDRLFGTK